jgi:hypothetical protein
MRRRIIASGSSAKEFSNTGVHPSTYIKRGHITDHIVSHMSQQFHFFRCDGCLESFRNRQKLYRHKKECKQFHELTLKSSAEGEEDDEMIQKSSLNLAMSKFFKLRSLDDIIAEELQG